MKIVRFFIGIRNFIINNFFVNIVCIKKNDYLIFLNSIYKYSLYLFPFNVIKLIANYYKYDLIYNMNGVYVVTNIKENRIIPFIMSCTIFNNNSALNISSEIRLYNSSIPLYFLIKNCNFENYDTIKIVYLHKGVNITKNIKIANIDSKYLIYNLFD